MIYFDNNATTQIAPTVFDAMRPFLTGSFGNPSSGYAIGRDARQAIDDARLQVADLLGATSTGEIIFTSCGTESDNWAIRGGLKAGGEKNHIITTRVEHDAVRKLCKKLEEDGTRVTWLDVDEGGSLDLGTLRGSLTSDTAIVSVMLANNETGVLFPVAEIGRIVKEHSDALFHVDGIAAVGKVPIDLKTSQIDLFSISGHKFHAPKGIGALYVRDGVMLSTLLTGGGQENGRRAGTEAVHQIAALGAAAELAADLSLIEHVRALRDRLEATILGTIASARLNGTTEVERRLPNTSNISFENLNGEAVIAKLSGLGVCVSTGSACNSSGQGASHVLQAMDLPYTRTMGSIRFSLGRYNTEDEVLQVAEALQQIVSELNEISG
jgi:cysteine desulfurase